MIIVQFYYNYISWIFFPVEHILSVDCMLMHIHYVNGYKSFQSTWTVQRFLYISYLKSYAHYVQYGILIGIGISLLLLLYPMARPKLKVSASSFNPSFCYPTSTTMLSLLKILRQGNWLLSFDPGFGATVSDKKLLAKSMHWCFVLIQSSFAFFIFFYTSLHFNWLPRAP